MPTPNQNSQEELIKSLLAKLTPQQKAEFQKIIENPALTKQALDSPMGKKLCEQWKPKE